MERKRENKNPFHALLVICGVVVALFAAAVYGADEARADSYDVNEPHVLVNQVYGNGAAKDALVSHSFIELFNPTDKEIDLSGWSVQYRSSKTGNQADSWAKLNLEGSIPANGSFLIRCNESDKSTKKLSIDSYDMSWDQVIYNKGVSVVLLSSTEQIPNESVVFDNNSNQPVVSGYVDMLSVSGGDGITEQAVSFYEGEAPAFQTKNIAVRRNSFADTDNNATDAASVNYKSISDSNLESLRPRSSNDGSWGEYSEEGIRETLLSDIAAKKAIIPKYYHEYCTESSAEALDAVLEEANDDALEDMSNEELETLLTSLNTAVAELSYNYDGTLPQIYISTDKGDGTSYGTTLTKSVGYVSSRVAVTYAGGELAVDDPSAQIKIRGNSTSGGAKKPYNIKFGKKQDLFGLGKAKKWVLLADCFDPTLMRNEMGLDLAEKLGLSATPGHRKVEVWIDGKYNGLYLLAEKLEADSNRVNIDTKNGDFLLELDSESRIESGNIYLHTPVQNRFFRLRDPEDNVSDEDIEAIKTTMGTFETALSSGDYDNISPLIDEESFAAYYLLNEYMKTVDFSGLSVYFYCKDGVLYAGPAWDFDLSTGNAGPSYGSSQYTLSRYDTARAAYCQYFSYLMKYEGFRNKVYEKYNSSKEFFSDIYAEGGWIDRFLEKYSDGVARNYAEGVWTVSKVYSGLARTPDATYEENVEYLRDWCEHRTAWLESYVGETTPKGFIQKEDGLYFTYGGTTTERGLIFYDNEYYYVIENGKVVTGQSYEVTTTNDLLKPNGEEAFPNGIYDFDEVGRLQVPVSYENVVEVPEVEATCVQVGVTRHWIIERTGGLYLDAECTTAVTKDDIVRDTVPHTAEIDSSIPPTCTVAGLTEGSHCRVCDEVLEAQQEMEALGHDYSISYNWSEDGTTCTAKAVCSRDEEHVISETVNSTAKVKNTPTTDMKGTTTYTAYFTNALFLVQSKDIEDIPAIAAAADGDDISDSDSGIDTGDDDAASAADTDTETGSDSNTDNAGETDGASPASATETESAEAGTSEPAATENITEAQDDLPINDSQKNESDNDSAVSDTDRKTGSDSSANTARGTKSASFATNAGSGSAAAATTESAATGNTAADSSPTVSQIVSVGDTVTASDSDAKYTVTSADDKTVAYAGDSTSKGNVKIASTVTTDSGAIYTVTSIASKAFAGNKNITSVTLPNTVTTIGSGAFKNCTKLKKVTLSKKIKTIGKNAFSGDKNLKTITIKSTKLKSVGKNAFKNVPKTAVIKVPKKQKAAYTKLLRNAGIKGKIIIATQKS